MLINREKFILASSSKSRYKILKNIGLHFKRVSPKCNEEQLKKKLIEEKGSPKNIVLELSKLKALSVSNLYKDQIVVGSDTVVEYKKKLIDKAKNLQEAKKKILLLSGKKHNIFTSISICLGGKVIWHTTQKTIVVFRKLKEKEVDNYILIAGKDILSSVGCFQIEKYGPLIIKRIDGDFFNVMGFPLFSFLSFLNKKTRNLK